METISVIMPVFNAEHYIYDAVKSVLEQTHSEFELIIINDGSTDSSYSIITELAKHDTRIKVTSQKNQGIVAALNAGIDQAQGNYIARMDADDICLPERFARQLQFLKDHSLDLCGSSIEFFGRGVGKRMYPETHDELFINLMTYGKTIAHPTVLARSLVFKSFRYSSEYKDAEDLALWMNIALNSDFSMGNYPGALLRYRVHEAQVSKAKKTSQLCSTDKAIADFIGCSYSEFTAEEISANGLVSRQRNVVSKDVYSHHLSYLKKLKKILDDKSISEQFFDQMLLRICKKGVSFKGFTLNDYLELACSPLPISIRLKLNAKSAFNSVT